MFTGIVAEVGRVAGTRRRAGVLELDIDARGTARALEPGDSVAVAGTCLTAIKVRRARFRVQVVPETEARTTIGSLSAGDAVNLELAARPQDRLGGHLVQGHVDCVARARHVEDGGGSRRVVWEAPADALRFVAPKGSVTLDGVSLTVVEVNGTGFEVALIPHTLAATTLARVAEGSRANLETDVIAKYVARLAQGSEWVVGKEASR
jgi:riboflavin synthase